MRPARGPGKNIGMFVANSDNIGGAVVPTVTQNRFSSLVALAEERLRESDFGSDLDAFVGELRRLAAESDEVAESMCQDDSLAMRFDNVVAAWKDRPVCGGSDVCATRGCPHPGHRAA